MIEWPFVFAAFVGTILGRLAWDVSVWMLTARWPS
jgi:hypothetical protein